MELHILPIGKLKDPGLEGLCDTYVRRSRNLCPIIRTPCRDHGQQWSRAKTLGGPLVMLDERGEQVDTVTLARWIEDWRDAGTRTVTFLIGDAHGFSADDRRQADRLLALSRLTLPHRLAQLVLCEQLYRAGTILAGHPYHHS